VGTSWTEAERFCRFVTALVDGAVPPSLCSTCIGGRGHRLLQPFGTQPSATDRHCGYGPKHSRHDESGVGQDETAR
jgi:hypothetical protein